MDLLNCLDRSIADLDHAGRAAQSRRRRRLWQLASYGLFLLACIAAGAAVGVGAARTWPRHEAPGHAVLATYEAPQGTSCDLARQDCGRMCRESWGTDCARYTDESRERCVNCVRWCLESKGCAGPKAAGVVPAVWASTTGAWSAEEQGR